jgi:hypothetical protein
VDAPRGRLPAHDAVRGAAWAGLAAVVASCSAGMAGSLTGPHGWRPGCSRLPVSGKSLGSDHPCSSPSWLQRRAGRPPADLQLGRVRAGQRGGGLPHAGARAARSGCPTKTLLLLLVLPLLTLNCCSYTHEVDCQLAKFAPALSSSVSVDCRNRSAHRHLVQQPS